MITKKEIKQGLLNDLYASYKNCMLCPLSEGRTQVVFGRGNADARLMLIGEAPGKNEDLEGSPFVGRSGKLLSQIFKELRVPEEDLYITNIVKCRPPNNRTPLPNEISACTQALLTEEIKIIQPRVLCALGSSAAHILLKSETPISQIRGKLIPFDSILLVATFHPAYILRNQKNLPTLMTDIELAYKASITDRTIY